ncbi:MAG: HlyD family efflux transporter periplasmic adaptor subunit [Deltaproteobacteria bacterium]|nr:HlyD family efflux transporter periplasmic adaptor subunit [Deltaproteobacteria bacterium]
MLAVLASLTMLFLDENDTLSIASGRLIPDGRPEAVAVPYPGKVKKVLVREGQLVAAGQPLIELDLSAAAAAAENRLLNLRASAERERYTRAVLADLLQSPRPLTDEEVLNHPAMPAEASSRQIILADYRSILSNSDASENPIQYIIHTLERADDPADSYHSAYSLSEENGKEFSEAGNIYIPEKPGYIDEKDYFKDNYLRLAAGLNQLKPKPGQDQEFAGDPDPETRRADLQAGSISDLAEAVSRIEALDRELSLVRNWPSQQTVASPVSGLVQDLPGLPASGYAEGRTVLPGEPLLKLVPLGETAEAEIFLTEKQVKGIRLGMPAVIKAEAFPFLKYGVIDASVASVVTDLKTAGKNGPLYRVRLKLSKNTIAADGREFPLLPGLAVTVEMKTGKKKLAECLADHLISAAGQEVPEHRT